jgi:hypothetical protein
MTPGHIHGGRGSNAAAAESALAPAENHPSFPVARSPMQGFVPRFPAPLDPRLLQSIRNRISLGFKVRSITASNLNFHLLLAHQGEFPNLKKLPDVSPKEASVLVPLCNFNNRFSILYAPQHVFTVSCLTRRQVHAALHEGVDTQGSSFFSWGGARRR